MSANSRIEKYQAFFCSGKSLLILAPALDGTTIIHHFDGMCLSEGVPCRELPWDPESRATNDYVRHVFPGYHPLPHLTKIPVILAETKTDEPAGVNPDYLAESRLINLTETKPYDIPLPIKSVTARLPKKEEDVCQLPMGEFKGTLWDLPVCCHLADDLYPLVRTVFGTLSVDAVDHIFLRNKPPAVETHRLRLEYFRLENLEYSETDALALYVKEHGLSRDSAGILLLAKSFLGKERGLAWVKEHSAELAIADLGFVCQSAGDYFIQDQHVVSLHALNRARLIPAK